MVVDFAQTVNRVTHLDAYPIPLVSDLLDQVSQYRYFSYIDLKAAFHQFHLDPTLPPSKLIIVFGNLHAFLFGLHNSPAAFNRALQNIISSQPGVVIYMDDVVVGGQNLQEYDVNLRNLINRASEANLTFANEKCIFQGTKLRFPISNGCISPNPMRADPFIKFPVPKTLKQLECFVGLAVHHSKWIPGFSRVMDPLFSALQSKSLPLSDAALKAIQQVKLAIQGAILYIVEC